MAKTARMCSHGVIAIFSMCDGCKHVHPDELGVVFACDAFPSQIPDTITENAFDHRKPFPGDKGFRFEWRDDGTLEKDMRDYIAGIIHEVEMGQWPAADEAEMDEWREAASRPDWQTQPNPFLPQEKPRAD